MSRSFSTRPAVALLFMMMGALGTSQTCGSNGKDTCAESPDVSEFLQNGLKVAASIEPVEVEDDDNLQPVEPPPIDLIGEDEDESQPIGGESICGTGEEVTPTTCIEKNSLVRSQAKATAHMKMGGCCTAWLVKSKTAGQGALMLSTGHCGGKTTAKFEFDDVDACPAKGVPKPTKTVCTGTRLSVEQSKDEHAIYELPSSCTVVDSITPILLDIGVPDNDEGMYLIGHPRCKPKFLSHKEVHDEGHHCEVRGTSTWGSGSERIKYYCDTSGGNSGSPVFSARTGYAFAIHSHGGCSSNKMSANWGGLLKNPGNVAAFKKYGIPYVDRGQVDLYKYEKFVSETSCPDHASSATITGKSEMQCKLLCVGSLTCVGFEYVAASQKCIVNYDSSKSPAPCQGGAVYFRRTATLMDDTTAPTPAPPGSDCDKAKLKDAAAGLKDVSKGIDDIVDKFSKLLEPGKPPALKDLQESGASGCNGKPCDACQGDCDTDSHCKGDLKCFQRSGFDAVPGCKSGGVGDKKDYDYCYDPTKWGNQLQHAGASGCNGTPCDKCQGDCDTDSHCKGNLKCFQRNAHEVVPGCPSGGVGDEKGYDYCYDPADKTSA